MLRAKMPERDDDMSQREIERQIADMKREKIKMEDNIRRLEANSKRIFGEDNPRRNPAYAAAAAASASANESRKRDRSEDREDEKKSKKHDRKTTVNDDEEEEDEKDDKDDKDKEKEEKDEKEDGETEKDDKKEKADNDKENDDKDDKKEKDKKRSRSGSSQARKRKRMEGRATGKPDPRGRNLFGKMLGHLQQAKRVLDTEKGSKAHELRMKAEERTEERMTKEKLNIQELRKRGFEQQKKDEEVKMAMIEKQIEEKELLLLQRRLESHYSLMMNFIRTQSEPTIFFLPAKHNKESEQKLEETRAAIKHKIASLKVQLQQMPDMPDEADPEEVARASAAAAAVAAAEGDAPPKAPLPEMAEGDSDTASIPDKDKKKEDDAKEDGDKDGEKDDSDEKKDQKKDKDNKASDASGSDSDAKD